MILKMIKLNFLWYIHKHQDGISQIKSERYFNDTLRSQLKYQETFDFDFQKEKIIFHPNQKAPWLI